MLSPIKEAQRLLEKMSVDVAPTPIKDIAVLLGAKIVDQPLDEDLSLF